MMQGQRSQEMQSPGMGPVDISGYPRLTQPFWLSGCAAIYFAVAGASFVREKYWRAASLRTTIVWSHSCLGYVYQVTLWPGSKQDPRELSVTGHRVLAVGREHLNPDVVRSRL